LKTRRDFLHLALAGSVALPAARRLLETKVWAAAADAAPAAADPWSQVPEILARIKPPVFPERHFDISKFGARGDNKSDCTPAFQQAIAACAAAGGGNVVVPAGEFSTGAIELKSGVNLHVDEGATIRFSRDPKLYPVVFTRWEGVELMNFSPFIYAFEQKNIGISGSGTIDGNADCEHWWPWKGRTNCGWEKGDPNQENDRNRLFAMGEQGVAVAQRVFGPGHYLRPQFVQPYRCQNVLIEGVTLVYSPMWQLHPVLCRNVTIRKVNVRTSVLGPNTDACDPESCANVLIQDCFFSVGDDCIAIKAGRNGDGRRTNTPTENVVIQGCHMKDGHGGVTIGSEISGGVRNVFAENCRMDSPDLDIALRFKNNAMRGGVLENIHVRNIEVGQVAQAAVAVDFLYEEGANGKFTPVLRNVSVENMRTQKAKYALYLRGFDKAVIENIAVSNCDFAGVANGSVIEHVQGLKLSNVRVNGKVVEQAG